MKVKKFFILTMIIFLVFISAAYGQDLGDVNSDSTVDIVDALLTAQYYVGLDPAGFTMSEPMFLGLGQGFELYKKPKTGCEFVSPPFLPFGLFKFYPQVLHTGRISVSYILT